MEQRVLPLKTTKPKAATKPIVFHVAVISTQLIPIVKIKATHFILDEDAGTVCFYKESPADCQNMFHKTGGYPTPIAMFKSRDVLSVTQPKKVKGKLCPHAWIASMLLLEGKEDGVLPQEYPIPADVMNGGNK